MKNISNKAKILYLILLILFISVFGLFWMDYIGLLNLTSYANRFRDEPALVTDARDDEPTLVEREEFEKEKLKFMERIEDLDKREALIAEREKEIESQNEKLGEVRKGLDLEKKKFDQEKNRYSGYRQNVKVLAGKMVNMPPEDSVTIMLNWEDPLIIDVLRQIDADAQETGRSSITPYIMKLMSERKSERASRILYLMTQI
ncbi:MAG: flagellar protein FlbB [Chrysiogenales bacterium]|nr:MAG: flagellar protein FlbB [Chrysiogenales bacterium]